MPTRPMPSVILDHLGDAVITTDPDFLVTTWNRAAREIYGYELHEVRGKPTMTLLKTTFDLEEESDRSEARSHAIAELLREGVWRGEVIQSHKDGRRLYIHSEVRILQDDDGARIGAVAVNRDVTAQREAQATLAQMQTHLTEMQRAEALGKLAGSVAHDFNNLLAILQGHADLALLTLPPRHPARRSLDKISTGIERGSMLSRQLLSFGRRDTLDISTFDLVAALHEVDEVLRCLVGGANRLVIDAPDAPVWVRGSRSEVEQVLVNLCTNARDAIVAPGTVTIAIVLTSAGTVELSVTDTGCGMSQAVAARAFETFFTTKPPGKGSGLGLAVVSRVAHRHGGSVTITSTEGVGTRVSLLLPAGAAQDAAPVTGAEGVRLRVLVAEDQDLVREVLTALLVSLGHDAVTAADGESALALARSQQFDLLLTDVSMPRLTGPALARAIRADRPQLPIIYLSGFPAGDLDPWPAGVWRQKPITRASLQGALAEALAMTIG